MSKSTTDMAVLLLVIRNEGMQATSVVPIDKNDTIVSPILWAYDMHEVSRKALQAKEWGYVTVDGGADYLTTTRKANDLVGTYENLTISIEMHTVSIPDTQLQCDPIAA